MAYRPRGVTAIAVVFLIIGVIGFSIGIGLGIDLIAVGQTQHIESFGTIVFGISYILSGLPANILFLYAYMIGYVDFQLSFGLYQMEVVGAEIVGMIFIFPAIGLFYMKRWGRYLALILGTIFLIGGLIGLVAIVGILPFAFGLIIVLYLRGDVKYEFQ